MQPNWKEGAHSLYIPLHKKLGIKLFRSKLERDRNWRVQQYFADYNLAPYVVQKTRLNAGFNHNENLYEWGFVTENADTNLDGISISSLCHLIKDIRKHGFPLKDDELSNFGIVQRDGFSIDVCIDFGEISEYDNPEICDVFGISYESLKRWL